MSDKAQREILSSYFSKHIEQHIREMEVLLRENHDYHPSNALQDIEQRKMLSYLQNCKATGDVRNLQDPRDLRKAIERVINSSFDKENKESRVMILPDTEPVQDQARRIRKEMQDYKVYVKDVTRGRS